jgi:hypothetical protein
MSDLAADGAAKFVRLKEEAGETMEFARLKADEAKALNETLQHGAHDARHQLPNRAPGEAQPAVAVDFEED